MELKKRYARFLALVTAALLMQVQVANAVTSGSYVSSSVGQTIYTKNYDYYNYFPIVGSPPSSGKITTVSYRWGFSYRPTGLRVSLCHGSNSTCIDVTNIQSGTTSAFNSRSPTTSFFLLYRVNGTGTMLPAYSNNDQLIVNYNY